MAAPFKDHFSTCAADYARYRPTYPAALVAHLAGLAPERRHALDCGCGTGQLATRLAGAFARVTAVDASPALIADAEPCPGVTYRVAPAEATGEATGSVDLVAVAQAAHWFDLPAFYAEARRVLRPGGAVALIAYGVVEAEGAVGTVLGHFYTRVIGPYWPAERRHVEEGYRSLPFPFAQVPAPALAMAAEWSLAELLGYVETWSAVRRAEAALGRAPYAAFAADLAAVWGPPATRRAIRWPLSVRVGHV